MAGNPVATMVWSTELMNRAIETMAKTSLRRGRGSPALEPSSAPVGTSAESAGTSAESAGTSWSGQGRGTALRWGGLGTIGPGEPASLSDRVTDSYSTCLPTSKQISRGAMDVEMVARLRGVISRLARRLNATSTDEGLTPTQYSVLGLIAVRGPLGLTELTDLEGLNPTMLSRVVRKLDDEGLIRRQPDPADQRAVRVQVTPAGAQVHERIRTHRTQVLYACLERLPVEVTDELLRAVPMLEAVAEELK